MAGKRRMDAVDTVDLVTGFLHRLQAEGWALDEFEHHIEYAQVHKDKGPILPVGAELTIRLIPR